MPILTLTRFSTPFQSFLFVVFLFLFLGRFYIAYPYPVILERVYEIGAVGLIGLSAWGIGHRFLLRLLPRDRSERLETGAWLEETFFKALTGLGALALGIFLLAVLGKISRPFILALLLAGLSAGGLSRNLGLLVKRKIQFLRRFFSGEPADLALAWLVPAGLLLSALAALAPPTFYDALVYHLAIPAAWLQAGRWLPNPIGIYSGFPKVGEMLFAAGLALGDDVIASGISFLMGILSLLGAASLAWRYFGEREARIAAALLAATPAFLLLSSGPYIETATMAFSLGTVYALCLYRETGRRGWLVLAGALAGLSVGTKYTGVLFAAAAAGMGIRRFKDAGIFLGMVILLWSPWLLENMAVYGNPVYPFLHSWMGDRALAQEAAVYFQILGSYRPDWHSLGELLALPFRPVRFGGGYDVLGDFGWALYLAGLPLFLFITRRDPILKRLGLYLTLAFLGWASTRWVLRFLTPFLPVLSVVTAVALHRGIPRLSPWARRLTWGGFAALVLLHTHLFLAIEDVIQPYRVAVGLESRQDYLTRRLTHYGACSYMHSLPPHSRVLILGEQRGYPFPRDYQISSLYRLNPLVQWSNECDSGEEVHRKLAEWGFTHVYVNDHELNRLKDYPAHAWTPAGRLHWERLRRTLTTLYIDTYGVLYRV